MQIIEVLREAQDGMALANLAAAFEADADATATAVESVVPEIASRIERNTLSRGGLAELVRALGDPRHRRALSDPSVFVDPAVGADGAAILGHIFGTGDAVRAVALRMAQTSGLGGDVAERMLPYIAALTMSGISKALLDALGSNAGRIPGIEGLPRGGHGDAGSPGGSRDGEFLPRGGGRPGGFDLPRPAGGPAIPQGGPPYQLPEITGAPDMSPSPMPRGGASGSPLPGPLDAGRGQGGGYQQPRPAPYPMPGPGPGPQPAPGNNPLDDLSDILRRRGATTNDGSPLGGIIRSILGSILGFGGGGMMSWLFRMIFLRFGWTILKRVIGRTLTGR